VSSTPIHFKYYHLAGLGRCHFSGGPGDAQHFEPLSVGQAISRVAEGGEVSTSFNASLVIPPAFLPLCCLMTAFVAVWSGIRINDTSVNPLPEVMDFGVSTILMSTNQLLGVVAWRNQRSLRRHLPWGIFHYCRYLERL